MLARLQVRVEEAEVYRKSVDFADQILATTEHFPRGYRFLADQLNRASVSIAANLAEGNGRFTKPDRKHFFGIARGSILECRPLLELAARRRLIDDVRHDALRARTRPFVRFLHVESAGGMVLVACTAVAILVANSRWADPFHAFWNQSARIGIGSHALDYPLWYWINDGLMTIFFFVIARTECLAASCAAGKP